MVILGTVFIAGAARIPNLIFYVGRELEGLGRFLNWGYLFFPPLMAAILLVGFVYGSRLGAVTILTYLCVGAYGLPIFPGANSGLNYIIGPPMGLLLGFVFVAWAAGWSAERGLARGFIWLAGTGIIILALLYVLGSLWIIVAYLSGWAHDWIISDFTWISTSMMRMLFDIPPAVNTDLGIDVILAHLLDSFAYAAKWDLMLIASQALIAALIVAAAWQVVKMRKTK